MTNLIRPLYMLFFTFAILACSWAEAQVFYTVTTPSGARIRNNPSLQVDSSIVTSIPTGTVVQAVGQPIYQPGVGHWVQVQYGCDASGQNCQQGWINQRIMTEKSDSVPLPTARPKEADQKPDQPQKQADTKKAQTPDPNAIDPKINKCISSAEDKSKDGQAVVRAFQKLTSVNGALTSAEFKSNKGWDLTLTEDQGQNIQFVVHNAPQALKQKVSAQYPGVNVDAYLQAGQLALPAQLCLHKGKASINFVGSGGGSVGAISLSPNSKGNGFQSSGTLTLSNNQTDVNDVFHSSVAR